MNLVLLSGGSGQRLWPLSNDIRSKQFIKIFHREDGELESMVQRVYRQIKAVDTDATVTIATSKSQVSAIANHGLSSPPARSFRATCTRKQGHRHGLKATSRFTRDITPR